MTTATFAALLAIVAVGCAPSVPPVEAPMGEAPSARAVRAVAPPAPPKEPEPVAVDKEVPPHLGGDWKGIYVCAQGTTALLLQIDDSVPEEPAAVFEFTHPPTGVHGAFTMRGTFEPRTRHLLLHPGKWLDRPAGYVPVDVEANLSSDGTSLTGRIAGPGCTVVILQRQ